ncbi:Rieske (2Fe-2S) protein, partial [Klebsiella pneumoniae]
MTGRTHDRRTVLTTCAAVAGVALGGTALTACAGGNSREASQSQPSVAKGTELAVLDDIPVGSAVSVTTPDDQEIIVSRRTENEVVAFHAICTHQGCTVLAEES